MLKTLSWLTKVYNGKVHTSHKHADSIFNFPTFKGGSYQEMAICYGLCEQRVVLLVRKNYEQASIHSIYQKIY